MKWPTALALFAVVPAQAQDTRVADALKASGFSGYALRYAR